MPNHTQTILACPERKDGYSAEGVAGDCFRACLMTILDIPEWYPLKNIPNFANEQEWWKKARVWTRNYTLNYGRKIWDLAYFNPATFPAYLTTDVPAPQNRVIVAGKSPRGDWHHAVVADHLTGEILWDPHPSRDGLDGDILDVICLVTPYT